MSTVATKITRAAVLRPATRGALPLALTLMLSATAAFVQPVAAFNSAHPPAAVRVNELRLLIESQLRGQRPETENPHRTRGSAAGVPAATPLDQAVFDFYAARGFRPAWLDTLRLTELRQLGRLAELHGLNGADYRFREIADRIDTLLYTDSNTTLAQLELLTTRNIARFANHLRNGKLELTGTRARLRQLRNPAAMTSLLHDAAASESVLTWLDNLAPQTLWYRKLQLSLARHRQQQADGTTGVQPRPALNTVAARIDQLRVNLEWQRWAAMPADRDFLRVNIPSYELQWFIDGDIAWQTRAQVGKRARPTPTFKSAVSAIMTNPAWTVPPTIFREDILPRLRDDASYLQTHGMYLVDHRGRRVEGSRINWHTTEADTFPFRVRRGPGPGNALGRYKFLVPNPYLIYLHDTPAKALFARPLRATSSGCIRIEAPDQLAKLLVNRQSKRTAARLAAARVTDKQRYIGLQAPVPIIVLYATVMLDDKGELVFADDVYGRDADVLAALDAQRNAPVELLLAEAR